MLFPSLPLIVLLSSVQAFYVPEQKILDIHSTSSLKERGLLRRFAVNGSHDSRYLLQIAQENDLDVWQVTPEHVDMYLPSSSSSVSSSRALDILQRYPFSDTTINATIPYHHRPRQSRSSFTLTDEWDLPSLENSTFHSNYHPLYEIDTFLREIASLHPELVNVVTLGHSGEGREMYALTLSRPETSLGASDDWANQRAVSRGQKKHKGIKKRGFLIMGAQHAREWVATSTSLYLAHALVSNASEPLSLSHLLDYFDFHFVPVPNPDGYDYTWESDRFWYKNRMILGPDIKCQGLDMNRNWGYKWKPVARDYFSPSSFLTLFSKKKKTPTDPCSHWFPGHRPFEAPEVNNIANWVGTLGGLEAFVDLRSYGQMLSSPYSYSCKRIPKDAENQVEAALGATQALRKVHGTPFTTGSLCSMLYRAPGNIVDWMYARAGIEYSYAAHLRDTGTYGFALPPKLIRPVGEETANLIEYLVSFIIAQK